MTAPLFAKPLRLRFAARLSPQRSLRVAVVAAVVSLSALHAYRGSWALSALGVGLVGGAGVSLLFLRWPPLGLATLIAASMLVPGGIGTGTQTQLNVTVLLLPVLLGLWGIDMLRRPEARLLASRPILPLLAFAGVAVVAFGIGCQPHFNLAPTAPLRAQAGALAIFLLSFGAFMLVAHQVRELRWLKRLTWIFLVLGGLYMAGRLVPGLGDFTDVLFRSGASGSMLWTWVVALAFSQAVFNRNLHPTLRVMLAALVLATFYCGLFQVRWWASGWLPSLVAVFVILWVGASRFSLLLTLLGALAAALSASQIVDLVMVGDQQYSLVTRREAWQIMAKIIQANPVLGLGPANYYFSTPRYPILGWYVNFSSHNNYIDIVAQTGLLGLICFLWFAWEAGRLGLRLRSRVPRGFSRAYVYGALGGLAGTLVAAMMGDWVLPFVYNIGFEGFRASVLAWFFLGGLVSLEQMAKKQAQALEQDGR